MLAVYFLLGMHTPYAQEAPKAAPAAVRYDVQVNAPRALATLLRDNLDLERWRGNPRIDMAQLARMVKDAPEQVRTLVETEGYYSPQIEARLDTSGATPVARISVDPGTPTTVSTVEIELHGFATEGAGEPFDPAALRKDWALPSGRRFRNADWETAKRDLLRQVNRSRFARAQLAESRATVDPAAHTAALRIVVDSGPDVHFGQLNLVGLNRYPRTVVTNLNKITPGDPYSEADLQAFQTRLQDTGYFSSVEVSLDSSGQEAATAEAPNSAALTLPVLVRVTENKQRNVESGVGYSTNTGMRGQVAYNDLNVAGTRLKSRLLLQQRQQTGRADFYWPTTAQGYEYSVGGGIDRTDVEGQVLNVASVSGTRAWGTPRLQQSLTLEALTELRTLDDEPGIRSKSLPLTYSITKRELDNLVTPKRGYVLSGQLGGALLPVLTDRQFVRAYARAFLLRPLGTDFTLVLRAEAGAVASKSKAGVPATFLFRAGGDQSVRGYGYQELGVREDGAVAGGRYIATGSAELQYWFKPTWGAAVFYDAGNAADRVADLRPKVGYGVGARWRSPAGPINVDVAYGQAVRKVRLHFSLGFTF
ncbi:autotransporter assembly complex protein TamA [Massilia terrae]|uniref:Translocation and assembly module subunit TamA n=1 Tax=Massilia terrae TaxID=1811224 RepID=A0ABT2CX62_9BURK|nr:autotransporter assembly complex protein TamA [Massilia terrae]